MKDNKKHIDQFFKGKLSGLQPTVTESDWDAVLSKMEGSKPSRKGWLWLVLLLPVLSGLGWWSWSIFGKEQQPISNIENTLSIQGIESDKSDKELLIEKQNSPSKPVAQEPNASLNDDQPSMKPGIESGNTVSAPASSSSTYSGSVKSSKGRQPKNIGTEQEESAGPERQPMVFYWIMASKFIQGVTSKEENIIEHLLPEYLISPFPLFTPHIQPEPKSPIPSVLTISPYFGMNRYQSSFNAEDKNYQSYRRDSEHPVWLPDFGLRIEQNRGRYVFNTGLIYSQKGQQFSGQTRYMLYDSFPHLNPQGQIIGYFRVNYRDTLVTLENVSRLHYVEIPLNVGREFILGSKSAFTASVGTTFSVLTGTDGLVIAENLNLQRMSETTLFDYKKWMQSTQVEIKYDYMLGRHFSAGAGIKYKAGLTNIYRQEPFSQKLRNSGGFIELNYRF